MFARTDETDLLIPLHAGPAETPRWATFLDRLRRRTRSDYAGMVVGWAGRPIEEARQVFAGRGGAGPSGRFDHDGLVPIGPAILGRLRPGRVYGIDELIDPPGAASARRHPSPQAGAPHARLLRTAEPGGLTVWTILLRAETDFTAGDAALLAGLAPHLTVALANLAALEDARDRDSAAEAALGRAGIGWATFDVDARLIQADPAAGRMLHRLTGTRRLAGERLPLPSADAARALADAASAFARDPAAASRIIPLGCDPPAALLTRPLRSDRPAVAMLALIRTGDRNGESDRPALLAALFGLGRGEARLADALASGEALANAAARLGYTIETARNYSKRLYAKTGTRGQADLVRLILTSVAVLG